jgi:hypothetical protein
LVLFYVGKITVFKDSVIILNKMDSKQEIISKVKFIGKVKKGEKINTRHMYVQPDGFRTTLSRTFIYQDNRGNALSFCQETIGRAFELLYVFERSDSTSDKILFKHLLQDLHQATIGLRNLKVTYLTDTKFCCDMDALLEQVDARLANYEVSKEIEESTPI